MEQTKNEPTKENKAAPETGKPKKEREPLTEAQRLKRQKMIVLPAMVLVFIGAMWLIFAPSSGKEQPPGTDGYNTEMPDADKANRQIIGDKLKAYEHGEMEERQESRNRAIGQLGDMFDREIAGTENGVDFDLANPGGKEERAKPATPQTIQSSAAAYRDLNATLGNFYDQPKNDNAEMDELLERIASLESELESERGKASSMDEQVALMEKSYELAAKYMGGQNGGQPSAEQRAEPTTVQKGKKNKAMPIRQVEHQVVSSLSQPMSNAEFVAALSQERNRGFNTAVGTAEVLDRNTIPACVHGAQSVTDGQTVRLRLLEPMAVAVHAMRSALAGDADRSKSIAVCGLGTIGMLLVLFLIEAGYTNIYVMGNKASQRSMAAAAGVPQENIFQDRNIRARDWLMAQTKGAGADVFFECVGKTETISDALLCTAPNGMVQLVGNPASDIGLDQNTYWKILRSQLTVKGSWNSSFTHNAEDDWQYVLDRLQHGRIQPQQCITHQFVPSALEQGLLLMRDKTEAYMKVMQTGDWDK